MLQSLAKVLPYAFVGTHKAQVPAAMAKNTALTHECVTKHSTRDSAQWTAWCAAPNDADSRIPEAPLCCALRTNRGMAFWPGGAVSLPSIEEVRNSLELSQFHMKICIGELFLEAQAGFLDFLAQAEWPRLGIRSTPFCCAL